MPETFLTALLESLKLTQYSSFTDKDGNFVQRFGFCLLRFRRPVEDDLIHERRRKLDQYKKIESVFWTLLNKTGLDVEVKEPNDKEPAHFRDPPPLNPEQESGKQYCAVVRITTWKRTPIVWQDKWWYWKEKKLLDHLERRFMHRVFSALASFEASKRLKSDEFIEATSDDLKQINSYRKAYPEDNNPLTYVSEIPGNIAERISSRFAKKDKEEDRYRTDKTIRS